MNDPQVAQPVADPWVGLRRLTSARIALGRAGGSLPTLARLDFALAHARAVDAVHRPFAVEPLSRALEALCRRLQPSPGLVTVATAAMDPVTHLLRPDLGRRLSDESVLRLMNFPGTASGCDLAVIVADGLSALAVERHAPAVLEQLLPRLLAGGWRLAPVVVASYGRVAVQDEIGQALRAAMSLILIGERPGLGSPDSLGAYFVFDPKRGNTDADRNCVSNIRPAGLEPALAAARLGVLLGESRRRRLSGVGLKDDTGPVLNLGGKTGQSA